MLPGNPPRTRRHRTRCSRPNQPQRWLQTSVLVPVRSTHASLDVGYGKPRMHPVVAPPGGRSRPGRHQPGRHQPGRHQPGRPTRGRRHLVGWRIRVFPGRIARLPRTRRVRRSRRCRVSSLRTLSRRCPNGWRTEPCCRWRTRWGGVSTRCTTCCSVIGFISSGRRSCRSITVCWRFQGCQSLISRRCCPIPRPWRRRKSTLGTYRTHPLSSVCVLCVLSRLASCAPSHSWLSRARLACSTGVWESFGRSMTTRPARQR